MLLPLSSPRAFFFLRQETGEGGWGEEVKSLWLKAFSGAVGRVRDGEENAPPSTHTKKPRAEFWLRRNFIDRILMFGRLSPSVVPKGPPLIGQFPLRHVPPPLLSCPFFPSPRSRLSFLVLPASFTFTLAPQAGS